MSDIEGIKFLGNTSAFSTMGIFLEQFNLLALYLYFFNLKILYEYPQK